MDLPDLKPVDGFARRIVSPADTAEALGSGDVPVSARRPHRPDGASRRRRAHRRAARRHDLGRRVLVCIT